MNWMPEAIRDGIVVVLVISGPLVLAAAFIGLVIGVIQAATQVQEQTIGSALKIIGVFALIIFAGFWMYQYLNQYTSRTLSSAFTFIPRLTQKAIPTGALDEKAFKERFEEKIEVGIPSEVQTVTPPEKIESEIGEGSLPPTLGIPEIPKPPQVTKILPAQPLQPPIKPIKPKIPLSDFQEPIDIQKKSEPMPQGGDELNIENQTENTNENLINVVPGEPIQISNEENLENAENDQLPSWLED